LEARASLMTPAQTNAIRNFLLFTKKNEEDRERLDVPIDAALRLVWLDPSSERAG